MARPEINRSGEMETFVEVVRQGSFSAGARALGLTPSAVSKLVARMEGRLGTRLVNRSTRLFRLTPEGSVFYERAVRILADIEEAERNAGAGEAPVGHIRVNTSASYATHVLAPVLPAFLECHPGVTLEMELTDTVVDVLAERTDVAVRAGPLKSSSLVARKLGETGMTVVAAPSYLSRFGRAAAIEDLSGHRLLGLSYARSVAGWPFWRNGEAIVVPVRPAIQASDGEGLRRLVLGGSGLGRLATFTIARDLAAGRLVPLLEEFNPYDREAFHAVYVGQGGPLPARVRVFLDFLALHGRIR